MPIPSQPRRTRGHTGTREEAHRHEDRCAEADRLRHELTHGIEAQEHSLPWQPSTRWFTHMLPSSMKNRAHVNTATHKHIHTVTDESHGLYRTHTCMLRYTQDTQNPHTLKPVYRYAWAQQQKAPKHPALHCMDMDVSHT